MPLLLLLVLIFGYKKAAETFYASTTLTVSDNFFVLWWSIILFNCFLLYSWKILRFANWFYVFRSLFSKGS